jgi:hypothetical protein
MTLLPRLLVRWLSSWLVLGNRTSRSCTTSNHLCWKLTDRTTTAARTTAAALRNDDFDFSSVQSWNTFYEQRQQQQQQQQENVEINHQNTNTNNNDQQDTDDAVVVEWHNSVSFSTIIDYIPTGSSCLIIGCGNSRLPKAIYDARRDEQVVATHICCLDSSPTALEQLKQQFHSDTDTILTTSDSTSRTIHQSQHSKPSSSTTATTTSRVSFVCDDAVELTKTLEQNTRDNVDVEPFDMIIDKGLMDALLCGEGWDGPVERLLTESIQILNRPRSNHDDSNHNHPAHADKGGTYMLISYPLPKSTEAFLQDVTTASHTMEWSFRRPESNTRVQISIGTIRTRARPRWFPEQPTYDQTV